METLLTLLLIRFAVIAGGLVLLGLLVFAAALVLKRRGKLAAARRRAAPAVGAVAEYLADRDEQRRQLGAPRGARGVAGAALRAAARHLDDADGSPRGTTPR